MHEPLFSEHRVPGCTSGPFADLWSPQILPDFFSHFLPACILSSLGRDRSDDTHGGHPAQQELLCCTRAHRTWEGGMTWREVTGRQAAKAWENHHACVFVFHPAQQKRLVNSSWMSFRTNHPPFPPRKRKKNPAGVCLRLIITGIIMIYSHHKSWSK